MERGFLRKRSFWKGKTNLRKSTTLDLKSQTQILYVCSIYLGIGWIPLNVVCWKSFMIYIVYVCITLHKYKTQFFLYIWFLNLLQIKSYPRTIKDSLRLKSSKRADKRQELKKRKELVSKYFRIPVHRNELQFKFETPT